MQVSKQQQAKRSRARVRYPLLRRQDSAATAIACGVYSACEGDLAKKALDHLKNGRWLDLVSMEIKPGHYDQYHVDEFRDDYLVAESFSKFPNWETGIDKELAAITKFLASEAACAETSVRLKAPVTESTTRLSGDSLLEGARFKLRELLGPFNWDEAAQHFCFGPGATFKSTRARGDAYYKFGTVRPDTTRQCAMLAACAIAQVPRWYTHLAGIDPDAPFVLPSPSLILRDHLDISPGNRITTVPKNAKTDRIIAIEPLMNGYIQHGIGGVIRHRLKKVGVNLDDQTLNQRLAKEASILGSLCTIDLSAASDSVSMTLVERLLPPDWVEAIEQSRSHKGVLPDGTYVTYHKVSSMGNGFTFELESAIFWALVSTVVDHYHGVDRRVAVYGDDIIVPSAVFGWVEELLLFAGFSVNEKKSFFSGHFRESCGKHYFSGRDVTPFYVRKDIVDLPALLLCANNIRRYAGNRYPYGLDGRFENVYRDIISRLPPVLRKPRIPDGFGDMSLIGDLDEVRPHRCPRGRDGWIAYTGNPSYAVKRFGSLVPALLRQLDPLSRRAPFRKGRWWENLEVVGSCDGLPVPKRVPSVKFIEIFTHRWENLGPWLM